MKQKELKAESLFVTELIKSEAYDEIKPIASSREDEETH